MFRNISKTIKEIRDDFFLYLWFLLGQQNLKKIEKETASAAQIQKKLLKSILRLQKNTQYGKKYNFATIRSATDFQKAHPLTTYEHYKSIIEDIANTGNFTQLVAEPITFFQVTSGTTGKGKLIPRTKRLSLSFLKISQAMGAFAESYYQKQRISTKNCRTLGLVNALPLDSTPSGILTGSPTSKGLRQLNKSKLARQFVGLKFTSSASVFLIPDYKEAYYCHLLFALLEPRLSSISANFASNILEALQTLEQKWPQLVDDIEFGRIDRNLNLDPATREELESSLQPNPALAESLRTEFEKGFQGILPRIWNQLSCIACITTGSMRLYRERLEYYANGVPFYSGAYGASEAWIGINLDPQREPQSYVIAPHSAFFEFIPIKEIDADTPTTVDLTSLCIGESYEIVVTTVAGLYRYRMGDIVRCIGFYNQSPIVEFLYRRGSLLNLAGEKVSEDTIFTALTEGIKTFGDDCQIVDYSIQMEFSSHPWRYAIYLEVSKILETPSNLQLFRDKIEQVICELNQVYSILRKSNIIGALELNLVSKDSFKELKTKIISQGSSEAQFKMPRLLNNLKPELVEFLQDKVYYRASSTQRTLERSLIH